MSLIRSATLRASSLTKTIRPTSALRLQPRRQLLQQAIQRRTYASDHGSHGEAKGSDVPWMAAAGVGTVAGLFFVFSQDLGHGESHDDHHGEAHSEEHEENDNSESKDESKDEEAGKKDEKKDEDKKDKKDKDESKKASPDKSDKADARKEAKSANETSGKQQGLSNADTHHSTNVAGSDDKSKKGEGVAETAKLKGTVSTDRPSAENKEERGKNQQDKKS